MPRLVLAFVLAAAGLAGCLGYGQKDTVEHVITTDYTRADPADCTRLETQRLVEQVTFYRGTGALILCRSSKTILKPATSVTVSHVVVHGKTAFARVAVRGGQSDGQRRTVRLVKDSSGWKLDKITALHIDRAKFEKALKRLFAKSPRRPTTRQMACYIRELRRASDAEIERAFVHTDPSVFEAPGRKCALLKPLPTASR